MKFIITKEVEAGSLAEALKKEQEGQGEVIGINRPKENAEPRKLDVGFKYKEQTA